MTKNIEKILNTNTLAELLDAINEFCEESAIRDMDDECMELVEWINEKGDSEPHELLAVYLDGSEDAYEVIENLCEFSTNCEGFVEADKEMTQQITKSEFEAVLDECEAKCNVLTCIEKEHTVLLEETPLMAQDQSKLLNIKDSGIKVILSRIDININKQKYIAETIGEILYNVLVQRIAPDILLQGMKKFIPEIRNTDKSCKELFKKYFYSVLRYEERKPAVYTKFDEHMKRRIEKEFFSQIIFEYLRE